VRQSIPGAVLALALVLVLGLGLAGCVSTPPVRSATPVAPPAGVARDLQAFADKLDSLRVAKQIPGLSVAVIENGAVIFARGFGHADIENDVAATPDTPYNIASVTKPISAVMALLLAERGTLSLDTPMAQYSDWARFFTDLSRQPTIFTEGLQCDPPVHTLRHLLTHTARHPAGQTFSYNREV